MKALGPIDPAIDLDSLGPLLLGTFDKTLFSMITQDVKSILDSRTFTSIVIFGIEVCVCSDRVQLGPHPLCQSHVCVLQTVLSLLTLGKYSVHVVADGVSSCNSFEIPVALDRMRTEGAIIGTSESIAFQLMGDAGLSTFKVFSKFIKEVKESTQRAGELLLAPGSVGQSGAVNLGIKSAM